MRDPERAADHECSSEPTDGPPPESERHLVARIRAGDDAAFQDLYLAQYPSLVAFVTGMLGSRSAAEDVVQDVFAELWRQRTTWQPVRAVPYLFRAARHRAIDALRRERRVTEYTPSVLEQLSAWRGEMPQASGEAAEAHELQRALAQAIVALPKRRRMALALRVVQGMSYAEIGVVLGISDKAAFILVARAREALQPVRDRFLQDGV